MQPDEPTEEESQQQLPQDGQTPFQPADPPREDALPADNGGQPSTPPLDDTHPATDSGVDPQQQYDEGTAGAAQAQEPNTGNVGGYTPPAAPAPEDEDKADSPS